MMGWQKRASLVEGGCDKHPFTKEAFWIWAKFEMAPVRDVRWRSRSRSLPLSLSLSLPPAMFWGRRPQLGHERAKPVKHFSRITALSLQGSNLLRANLRQQRGHTLDHARIGAVGSERMHMLGHNVSAQPPVIAQPI